MQYHNYDKWSDVTKRMQQPFQAMTELNIRTLQNLNYLKPEDLTQIKKPEELFEKQMDVFVQNGHKTLDYMQQSFQIFEKAMVEFIQDSKKAAANMGKK